MPIHLDPRLLAVAAWVRQGSYLADIGTDHGYLPIYLVQTGKISRAIAADINEKPLHQAENAIAEHRLQAQIVPVLSDGLEKVDSAVNDIVMAGMGGELIGSIIARTDWLKDPEKRLILQPMTQDVYLRGFLAEYGFEIEEERIAEDGRHLYVAFSVAFTGNRKPLSLEEQYAGKSIYCTDELSQKYLQKKMNRLEKIASGLEISGDLLRAAEQRALAAKLAAYKQGRTSH